MERCDRREESMKPVWKEECGKENPGTPRELPVPNPEEGSLLRSAE